MHCHLVVANIGQVPDQTIIMSNPQSKFWNFSVDLYAREGVADACLRLQDSHGLDVNLVLFCCWFGQTRGELPEATLTQALAFSSSWRQFVVQPLRDTRKWMKLPANPAAEGLESLYETLRERIKLDELAAEKYQQQVLENMIDSTPNPPQAEGSKQAALLNMARLSAQCGIEEMSLPEASLTTIISAMKLLESK